ncbi:30S ribosome-binding factor RbfA [Rickettsiales endosymbiont of Trichoplax sp. H2]|uniref:30S ribosome-binding factor RbfA n=1 Tax=Rickettsiales endosymbiont of Trichoplax sp. H2 TaxID=2021221 RepID=UPI0012B335BB|nr:30S ribosome-binding factor RbfA [Rickettsiales endosymbiont of Trichoplax sp. H2]MSO13488.1 Ribosome-binding factor A [Rickettsiales endosymbiont of Trichoplax sp. H2]
MTYQYKKPPTNRQLKVSELIKQEMAMIFTKGEVFLPELEKITITITDVKTSADLKISTVFINSVNDKIDKDLVRALNILSPEYRKKISNRINLKFSPQIRFQIDKFIDEKINIEKLFDKVNAN